MHPRTDETVRRKDALEKYCKIAIVLIIVAGIIFGIRSVWIWWDDLTVFKNPELIFQRHREELEDYVAWLKAGTVKHVSETEYDIPPFLLDRGATCVYWKDGSGTIIFFRSSVEAVPQLEYSPTGFDPQEIEERRKKIHYFRWQQLTPNWAACYWDS